MSKTDKVISWIVNNWGFVSGMVGVLIFCIGAVYVLITKVDSIGKKIDDPVTGLTAINNDLADLKKSNVESRTDLKWLIKIHERQLQGPQTMAQYPCSDNLTIE